ncbi:hypothetical protein [Crassaminicella thermophila]|nr:hypothetical protein [Crassaminicella thermophila]
MKYLRLERGHVPRKVKKQRRMHMCVLIISLVLAVICKLIHLGVI